MLHKTIFLAPAVLLAALLTSAEAHAWGAAHVGYTHVGLGGVQHYGATAVAGPGGVYRGAHVGGVGYGGAYRAGYAVGGAYGYPAVPYGGYAVGGFRAGGVYGGYGAGVYRRW